MNEKLALPLGPVMLDVEGARLNDNDIRRLRDPSVGGVILFSRHFESRDQLCQLIADIRALRDPELLIAVDQEGGRVQRFREDFTRIPPMAEFGKLYDQAGEAREDILGRVRACARLLAQELIDCGVDFSFAPVLDLGLYEDTVIGDRAFHARPETLVVIAAAFIEGMREGGMQATGKHFPGHGHVLADSHMETPVDHRPFDEIQQQDMRPFIELRDQLGAMMTAHIAFPEVDTALPTFSQLWLKKVLREQIGFQGLIFSDDLSMHGAHVAGGIVERARSALYAGCYMVVVCNYHAAIYELMAAGPFFASSESHQRFETMKACPKAPMSAVRIDQTQTFLSGLV